MKKRTFRPLLLAALTALALAAPVYATETSPAAPDQGPTQTIVEGEFPQNGNWYYRNADGSLYFGWRTMDGGEKVYYGLDGAKVFGEHQVDGAWWYFVPGTGGAAQGLYQHPDGKLAYYDPSMGRLHGAHTIDGVIYSFHQETGQVLTMEDETHQILRGIDVAFYQGDIDWKAVADSGVDFAIIRMLGWSNGGYSIDSRFDYNVRQAKANGIQVGVYLFSYAHDEEQAAKEVDYFLSHPVVLQHRAEGIEYELPVYLDYEDDRTHAILGAGTSYDTRTNAVRTAMQMLEGAGYCAGFYANKQWAGPVFDAVALQEEGYDFWLAYWPKGNTPNLTPGSRGSWAPAPAVWQYTSNGTVPGIQGRVDLDYAYLPKTGTQRPWKNPYTDVTATDWYFPGVRFVQQEGIMSGTTATTFSPQAVTTRGMIVKILYDRAGRPQVSAGAFTDVAQDAYYADAAAWAAAVGITGGVGEGRFAPDAPITREQLASMLMRYIAYVGADTTQRADLTRFSDADSIAPWAAEAMSWAVGSGLLGGVGDGILAPGGQAQRGQTATILMKLLA